MGQVLTLLYNDIHKSLCEICECPGTREINLVDPGCPTLLILCPDHHKVVKELKKSGYFVRRSHIPQLREFLYKS